MGPLIALGNKKALDLEDVPQLYKDDSVVGAFASLKTGIITLFKLVKALFFTAWKEILLTAFLAMTYTAASYVGPYLIDAFVQCLSGKSEYKNQGYVLAVVFLAGKIVERVAQRQWFFKLQQIGIRMRASVVAMIYNKGLTLSCMSKQGQTSGEIINIMTVDAQRIADFSWYLHDPWLVILQVGLALFILYRNLGIAAVATLVATVVVMLLNFPLGRLQEGYQEKLMKSKDERMKATSEILRNMRILKLQAWEMKFLSKIIELRKTESGWLKRYGYASALISFFFWGAPTFVSVATFGTCILLRIPLSSGKILSALATFRVLQAPIYNLPDTVSMLVQMKVSLDRIVSFLRLDDLQDDVVNNLLPSGDSDTAIEIVNGTFSWDSSLPNPTLRDINLKVLSGMKVAVCGTVGSGKSSLLSCILGEVPRTSGTVELCGTKAYVAQSPWIQSGTIRENVLFGKEMNEDKYDKVLEACALKKDLELFSFGDRTGIGERGINLSGGQKQRIQIARALYQDADIYLFDDPFSAVDAHTGSHLFKEVLLGHLGSKTVVYVTHQVEFLPVADIILVMKDGRITQAGKYSDILNSGSDFMELVCAHKAGLSAISKASESENETVSKGNGDATMSNNGKGDETDGGKTQGQLVQEEEREKGRVGFTVYWQYIVTAYGGALAPLTVLAHVMFQIGSNYWMAWATPVSEDEEPPVPPMTLIAVYVILAVACSLCILVRTTLLAAIAYKTATLLFNKMHLCIFRAPMSFFDSTPSGRILNRVAWQVFIVCVPVIAISIWYQVRYAPHLPLVLRGLSCTFEGGKKTGIVGRTGSGKSTLIQTLFRVVDPTAGKITIDGIDIASIGLHDLRSRLSIIPQDPTMFEGTVRNNLDPLEEYSDEQIWEALDKCQLGEEVRKKEKKLDSSVSENGENWSMGQRQLVCLGRVVLKKSKVLVLDEATASVDTATDNLIQHTLRQHFSDSTVITIAHRITSVLDSDMVLLLSHGLIEEYDTPARLLENKSSSFAQLVAEYSERSKEQY
ncbi:ABC transporter C family member 3 [Linum grandiflorum]